MNSLDLITMAIRNLWKRKLRTFLTVLGVIIGTAAIIVMVSLGIGLTESFEAQLGQMGDLKVITVNSSGEQYYGKGGMISIGGSTSSSKGKDETKLDDKSVNKFKNLEGVEAVTPVVSTSLRFMAQNGKYVSNLSIRGIDPSTMEAFGYKLDQGRLLEQNDELAVVFSGYVLTDPYMFYNPKLNWRTRWSTPSNIDFLNDKIEVSCDYGYGENGKNKSSGIKKPAKAYKINVVGTLEMSNGFGSYESIMPISQVQKLMKERAKFERDNYGGGTNSSQQTQTEYNSILVKCKTMEQVEKVQDIIKGMGFQTYSLTDQLKAMQESSKSIQALLGAIGGVSLLIAAIGITNTMVMSIYERTREIGVMKVIGAALKDIKRLFLIEAALIGFIGGLFGVSISLIISKIINSTGSQLLNMVRYGDSKISSIPLWLCLSSLAFSALVGIVSGYFPARRAMKLSALSAIRTE